MDRNRRTSSLPKVCGIQQQILLIYQRVSILILIVDHSLDVLSQSHSLVNTIGIESRSLAASRLGCFSRLLSCSIERLFGLHVPTFFKFPSSSSLHPLLTSPYNEMLRRAFTPPGVRFHYSFPHHSLLVSARIFPPLYLNESAAFARVKKYNILDADTMLRSIGPFKKSTEKMVMEIREHLEELSLKAYDLSTADGGTREDGNNR